MRLRLLTIASLIALALLAACGGPATPINKGLGVGGGADADGGGGGTGGGGGGAGGGSAGPAFQAKNGFVVMEVESAPQQQWNFESAIPGSVGGYYAWRGPNNPSPGSTSVLTYRFRIETAGSYSIKFRVNYTEIEGAEHNDWYARVARVDGGAIDSGSGDGAFHKVTAGVARNTWAFGGNWGPSNAANVKFNLAPGDHVLEIAPRSTSRGAPGDQNVHLDRVAVFLGSASAAATNPATPESPRVGTVVGN